MINKKLILFLLVFATSFNSFGWESKGHKMIAYLAEILIKNQVQDSVQYYLGDMTFEDASVWMDEVRDNSFYSYLKPMHYINIEKDKTYVKVEGANIMNELEFALSCLKKKENKQSVSFALKLFFHLIGDLHQPLHVGYEDDKGGNTTEVEYNGRKTNLHKLWDSEIIDDDEDFQTNCMIQTKINRMSPDVGLKIDLNLCMKESRALLKQVYDFKDGKVDPTYVNNARQTIESQISKAALRLASVLTQYFSK